MKKIKAIVFSRKGAFFGLIVLFLLCFVFVPCTLSEFTYIGGERIKRYYTLFNFTVGKKYVIDGVSSTMNFNLWGILGLIFFIASMIKGLKAKAGTGFLCLTISVIIFIGLNAGTHIYHEFAPWHTMWTVPSISRVRTWYSILFFVPLILSLVFILKEPKRNAVAQLNMSGSSESLAEFR